jgi:hypothetical protein
MMLGVHSPDDELELRDGPDAKGWVR